MACLTPTAVSEKDQEFVLQSLADGLVDMQRLPCIRSLMLTALQLHTVPVPVCAWLEDPPPALEASKGVCADRKISIRCEAVTIPDEFCSVLDDWLARQ
jgi:hypothetical protein